jgi:enterochelin esterase-like enzyme
MRLLAILSSVLAIASTPPGTPPAAPIPGFHPFRDARGGSVWEGIIPNTVVPQAWKTSLVYLPPGYSPQRRYPVFYVLHGLPGSPSSIPDGLQFGAIADEEIAAQAVRPFIAVMPPAGLPARYTGEWTGVWERYLVEDVVPWTDRHLATIPSAAARAIGGLSAGGYGAVDIGLRHPRLFGTLESWSGYYFPVRDGSLRDAPANVLAAHDPRLLAARDAPLLRRLRRRFFVSCATTHDKLNAARAISFARWLTELHLTHELYLRPGYHNGAFWRAQLPAALRYAFAPSSPARSISPSTMPSEVRTSIS